MNQEELNEAVTSLTETNTRFEAQFVAVRAAQEEEKRQIQILIDANPNLDLTELKAAVARSAELATNSETLDEETDAIYVPADPEV